VPRRTSPAPKHRARRAPLLRRLGTALGVTAAALTTMGAAATSVLPLGTPAEGTARGGAADLAGVAASLTPESAEALRERGASQVSRSDRRPAVDPRKAALLRNESRSGGQVARTEELGGGDPRTIAQALLPQYGFGADQFSCLDALWTKERLGRPRRQPDLLGLRHPAGAARREDGDRGRRLGDQPGDADPVGTGLHRGRVRHSLRRLGALAGRQLVLSATAP
jgi:hypothetical protein